LQPGFSDAIWSGNPDFIFLCVRGRRPPEGGRYESEGNGEGRSEDNGEGSGHDRERQRHKAAAT